MQQKQNHRRRIRVMKDEMDGTMNYLFPSSSGGYYEASSLVLDYREKERQVICISTWDGCNLGCSFCANGRGIRRPIHRLSTEEMLDQIYFAMSSHTNFSADEKTLISLQRIGEPTLNLENIGKLINILPENFSFSLSTVGITKHLARLTKYLGYEKKLHLQLSLHAADDELRRQLIPAARWHTIQDLLSQCRRFAAINGQAVCLNYTLIKDVNDSPRQIEALARIARGPFYVKLSDLNPIDDLKPADEQSALSAFEILEANGIAVKRFHSRGISIGAGCGQRANLERMVA